MKSNQKYRLNDKGFAFIVPMTMAIVVGMAILIIGAYVIGEVGSTLEESLPPTASRSVNQQKTVNLIGNITDGFSDIVDIEIVVIIITALSMAIFAIMAVGTRPRF